MKEVSRGSAKTGEYILVRIFITIVILLINITITISQKEVAPKDTQKIKVD